MNLYLNKNNIARRKRKDERTYRDDEHRRACKAYDCRRKQEAHAIKQLQEAREQQKTLRMHGGVGIMWAHVGGCLSDWMIAGLSALCRRLPVCRAVG